jgi:hypothetical protein
MSVSVISRHNATSRAGTKGILERALAGEQNDFDNMPEDLRDGETGQTAEDAADSLERAVICCDDAITACAEATRD